MTNVRRLASFRGLYEGKDSLANSVLVRITTLIAIVICKIGELIFANRHENTRRRLNFGALMSCVGFCTFSLIS